MHFSIVQLITIREHRDCLQLKVIAFSSFYVALRTSNYNVIDLYDILIVGIIVVASHTHFCFVCRCMLSIFQNSEKHKIT